MMVVLTLVPRYMFTAGDCPGDPECAARVGRNFFLVIGGGIVVYGTVLAIFVRSWSR